MARRIITPWTFGETDRASAKQPKEVLSEEVLSGEVPAPGSSAKPVGNSKARPKSRASDTSKPVGNSRASAKPAAGISSGKRGAARKGLKIPAAIKRRLRGVSNPLDPANLEYCATLLLAKIVSTGEALGEIAARADPKEVLLEQARIGRDLREDTEAYRKLLQSSVDIEAAREVAPRDYIAGPLSVKLEDGPAGIKVLGVNKK